MEKKCKAAFGLVSKKFQVIAEFSKYVAQRSRIYFSIFVVFKRHMVVKSLWDPAIIGSFCYDANTKIRSTNCVNVVVSCCSPRYCRKVLLRILIGFVSPKILGIQYVHTTFEKQR